jgi:hypothetical protein
MGRTRYQTGDLSKSNLDLLLFVNLMIGLIGSIFLAWRGIDAGIIYSFLFLGTIAGLFLVFFHLKDDKTLKPITKYVRIPISSSQYLSGSLYLLGLLAPLLVQLILSAFFGGFAVSDLRIPVFGQEINNQLQSFSAAEIGGSMAWRIFIIMFVAGNVETFAYNFGIPIIGILMGYYVLKLYNDVKPIGFVSAKGFILSFALVFSTILFVVSHVLNSNYATNTAFVIAAVFLIVANVSIYLAGFMLVFWAGYHQTSNLIYLVQTYGFQEVFAGFISPFGLIFAVYLALIAYSVLRSLPKAQRELGEYFSS